MRMCLVGPTLWDPMDLAHQAPVSMGSSRHEYWSGLPFSSFRGSFWPRDWTHISCISCISRRMNKVKRCPFQCLLSAGHYPLRTGQTQPFLLVFGEDSSICSVRQPRGDLTRRAGEQPQRGQSNSDFPKVLLIEHTTAGAGVGITTSFQGAGTKEEKQLGEDPTFTGAVLAACSWDAKPPDTLHPPVLHPILPPSLLPFPPLLPTPHLVPPPPNFQHSSFSEHRFLISQGRENTFSFPEPALKS